jgi:hypothetical protein
MVGPVDHRRWWRDWREREEKKERMERRKKGVRVNCYAPKGASLTGALLCPEGRQRSCLPWRGTGCHVRP